MKTLEKIVNGFRISPHGITLCLAGVLNLGGVILHHGSEDPVHHVAQVFVGPPLIFGISFMAYSIYVYNSFIAGLKEHGFTEWHVRRHLSHYCDRQAYKAAAHALGFGEQFDATNRKFPAEEKMFKWMPEI